LKKQRKNGEERKGKDSKRRETNEPKKYQNLSQKTKMKKMIAYIQS